MFYREKVTILIEAMSNSQAKCKAKDANANGNFFKSVLKEEMASSICLSLVRGRRSAVSRCASTFITVLLQ